jgi:hypothetical protein
LVIRTDGALREVAPVMAGRDVFVVLLGKGFVWMCGGIHFFGAEMAAAG